MSILGSLVKKTVDLPKEYLEIHKLAIDAMAETQKQMDDLSGMRQERDKLRERVTELERKASRERELVRADGMYFRIRADGGQLEETPYCQYCWEKDSTPSRMTVHRDLFECPECFRVQRHARFTVEEVGMERQSANGRLSALRSAETGDHGASPPGPA